MTSATMDNGQLRLDEVYLSGSTGQGPAIVGGLALIADAQGLSVVGPEPSSVRTLRWGRVTTMAARQMDHLPDGRGAVTLEVEIEGQSLRFLVPDSALGPQGIGILQDRLSSLARMPVRSSAPLTDPVAIGGQQAASAGAGGSAPPGVVLPGPAPALGAQGGAGSVPTAQQGNGQTGVWAPATGGTLLGGQAVAGQPYVQVGKKRPGRRRRLVTFVVVVLVVGVAGGAFYEKEHKGSPTTTQSADSLIAAGVNLDPGQVPGWRGIAGTTAGVLGAYGFRDSPGGQSTSSGQATLTQQAATSFAQCTKLPEAETGAALTALGFSNGVGAVSGETASSSSPLYEDPAQPATSAESSAIVLATKSEQVADDSAFAGPAFASCFARYLDAVVPDLVGGSMSGTPFASVSVSAVRTKPLDSGVKATGFTESFLKKGRVRTVALSGSIEVVGGGRTIAAVETLTARRFPTVTALKLFASVEQNVSSESS